jgi:hypothetical protein
MDQQQIELARRAVSQLRELLLGGASADMHGKGTEGWATAGLAIHLLLTGRITAALPHLSGFGMHTITERFVIPRSEAHQS